LEPVGIETRYALLMDTDDEPLSGIWGRLSSQHSMDAELFDHDGDLLIFSTAAECAAAQLMIQPFVQQPLETVMLLLLPDTTDTRRAFTDYGFISHSNHPYVYADHVFLFSLRSEHPDAQPYQAFEQMDEHLLASFNRNTVSIFVTDSHSNELMERIARAYRCSITPLYLGETGTT
jgi:hypothetical protein